MPSGNPQGPIGIAVPGGIPCCSVGIHVVRWESTLFGGNPLCPVGIPNAQWESTGAIGIAVPWGIPRCSVGIHVVRWESTMPRGINGVQRESTMASGNPQCQGKSIVFSGNPLCPVGIPSSRGDSTILSGNPVSTWSFEYSVEIQPTFEPPPITLFHFTMHITIHINIYIENQLKRWFTYFHLADYFCGPNLSSLLQSTTTSILDMRHGNSDGNHPSQTKREGERSIDVVDEWIACIALVGPPNPTFSLSSYEECGGSHTTCFTGRFMDPISPCIASMAPPFTNVILCGAIWM